MPRLKSYTDSSEKSGYYILANVGGTHPITLQVSSLGEKIFQEVGYQPEDNIPTKIVWSMFDIGILYTSGTINQPPEFSEDTDEVFRQLNITNKLTHSERARLLTYLKEYNGPNQDQISQLRREIEQPQSPTSGEAEANNDLIDDLNRLRGLNNEDRLTDDEYQLLKSRLLDSNTGKENNKFSSGEKEIWREYLDEKTFNDLIHDLQVSIPDNEYDMSFIWASFLTIPKHPKVLLSVGRENDDQKPRLVAIINNEEDRSDGNPIEQEHKDRVRDYVDQGRHEIINNSLGEFRGIHVLFRDSPIGFKDEITDQEVRDFLNEVFNMINYIYDLPEKAKEYVSYA